MVVEITQRYYDSFKDLSKEEIQACDSAAKGVLRGNESINKEQLFKSSIFTRYKNNENFNAMVDMLGDEIDEVDAAFLVAAVDAEKDKNGRIIMDDLFAYPDEVIAATPKDFEEFKEARANAHKPDMGL